jgi:hypothetical protein
MNGERFIFYECLGETFRVRDLANIVLEYCFGHIFILELAVGITRVQFGSTLVPVPRRIECPTPQCRCRYMENPDDRRPTVLSPITSELRDGLSPVILDCKQGDTYRFDVELLFPAFEFETILIIWVKHSGKSMIFRRSITPNKLITWGFWLICAAQNETSAQSFEDHMRINVNDGKTEVSFVYNNGGIPGMKFSRLIVEKTCL